MFGRKPSVIILDELLTGETRWRHVGDRYDCEWSRDFLSRFQIEPTALHVGPSRLVHLSPKSKTQPSQEDFNEQGYAQFPGNARTAFAW